jgi:hypothetical protein
LNDEIKINKTFTKRWRIKIRNKKNKDWSWNTNNKENQTVNFKGEERKEDKKKPHWQQTTPSLSICHTNRKRAQRHFQWHGGRAFLADKRCHTRHLKCVGTFYVLVYAPYMMKTFFIKITTNLYKKTKFSSMKLEYNKKSSEKTESPIDACFNFFYFKCKVVILLCLKKWKK